MILRKLIDFISIDTEIPETTNCEKCTQAICCIVFNIVHTKNQGRIEEMLKPGGERCKYLGENNKCQIYQSRNKIHYTQCQSYDCHNAGILISEWIDANNINIIEKSNYIGYILMRFADFLHQENARKKREKEAFLKNLLEKYSDPESIYHIIEQTHLKKLFKDFQKNT